MLKLFHIFSNFLITHPGWEASNSLISARSMFYRCAPLAPLPPPGPLELFLFSPNLESEVSQIKNQKMIETHQLLVLSEQFDFQPLKQINPLVIQIRTIERSIPSF